MDVLTEDVANRFKSKASVTARGAAPGCALAQYVSVHRRKTIENSGGASKFLNGKCEVFNHGAMSLLRTNLPICPSGTTKIFIDEDYPETTVESTTTLSGLSYTLYSGTIEIEVTGDFGMITMYNGYTSRNITFDRAAPRYEKLIFSEGNPC